MELGEAGARAAASAPDEVSDLGPTSAGYTVSSVCGPTSVAGGEQAHPPSAARSGHAHQSQPPKSPFAATLQPWGAPRSGFPRGGGAAEASWCIPTVSPPSPSCPPQKLALSLH